MMLGLQIANVDVSTSETQPGTAQADLALAQSSAAVHLQPLKPQKLFPKFMNLLSPSKSPSLKVKFMKNRQLRVIKNQSLAFLPPHPPVYPPM